VTSLPTTEWFDMLLRYAAVYEQSRKMNVPTVIAGHYMHGRHACVKFYIERLAQRMDYAAFPFGCRIGFDRRALLYDFLGNHVIVQ
jgi:hypothetical protein